MSSGDVSKKRSVTDVADPVSACLWGLWELISGQDEENVLLCADP